ncbi:hypothetical protein LTR08_007167 [Meristemomyces frigidus]|nr:hypothetical protein LTR08_007167 [Meristemomyces frigidus]
MTALAVGCPYPPCTVPTRDLQPIRHSELRMDTHHRGRVLTLRRIAPVVKLTARSWTVTQESSSGGTERLEVILHRSNHGQDILESESMFMVKEPYYTLSDQGDPTLRIDHPSDLVVCTGSLGNDISCPSSGEPGGAVAATAFAAPVTNTAKECKDEGNAALKQRALPRALAKYTNGLQLVAKDTAANGSIACDLHRNRAYVNLLLNRLDEAKADGTASLTGIKDQEHQDLDAKAYFRTGHAAYNLGDFQEAKSLFEEQQRLAPSDRDAIAYLRKTEVRLHEQATGEYDFRKIRAGLSKTAPRADAASFDRNTEVKKSPGRGHGLFATRDMDVGEIVLCEKAFCVVWGHEDEALTVMTYDVRDDMIRGFPAGLCKAIVQKVLNNPSQIEKVMDLYGDYQGIGKHLIMRDSGPVIDTFKVHDIVARNAFGPGPVYSGGPRAEEDVRNASTGLWIRASYLNHSCVSNSKKEYVGDLMVLRAARPIGAGEEITHSYNESGDYDARTAALKTTWGFACTCALCLAEKADGTALRTKRRALELEADAWAEVEHAAKAKRISIVKARCLARSINDTYEDVRYNGLPRTALLRIRKWLTEATTRDLAGC